VGLKLIYKMFGKLLSWMVLHARSENAKETEVLVLRDQLAVLRRRAPRPRISWTDRAVIAALARLLPARRRFGLLITPAMILRQLAAHGRPVCVASAPAADQAVRGSGTRTRRQLEITSPDFGDNAGSQPGQDRRYNR
jgi:hypothetical protein